MIEIGENVKIERYEQGYKVRHRLFAKPTKKNPNGSMRDHIKYFSTLEQACMHVADQDIPESGDAKMIVDGMKQTRQAIVDAIRVSH